MRLLVRLALGILRLPCLLLRLLPRLLLLRHALAFLRLSPRLALRLHRSLLFRTPFGNCRRLRLRLRLRPGLQLHYWCPLLGSLGLRRLPVTATLEAPFVALH